MCGRGDGGYDQAEWSERLARPGSVDKGSDRSQADYGLHRGCDRGYVKGVELGELAELAADPRRSELGWGRSIT